MPFAEDKEQVTKSIFLNKEDKELIKELADQGVDLFIQMVPSENKIDAQKFI